MLIFRFHFTSIVFHFEGNQIYYRYINFYFLLKLIFSTNYSYKIVYLANCLRTRQLQSIFNLPSLITRKNKSV